MIFLQLFLKEIINQILASNKDFIFFYIYIYFFFVILLFQFEKNSMWADPQNEKSSWSALTVFLYFLLFLKGVMSICRSFFWRVSPYGWSRLLAQDMIQNYKMHAAKNKGKYYSFDLQKVLTATYGEHDLHYFKRKFLVHSLIVFWQVKSL